MEILINIVLNLVDLFILRKTMIDCKWEKVSTTRNFQHQNQLNWNCTQDNFYVANFIFFVSFQYVPRGLSRSRATINKRSVTYKKILVTFRHCRWLTLESPLSTADAMRDIQILLNNCRNGHVQISFQTRIFLQN